jgi:hypothetical protein
MIGGDLVNAAGRLGLAIAVPILVGAALFTPRIFPLSDTQMQEGVIASDGMLATDDRDAGDEPDDRDGANGFVDRYGNEVTDAVATYTFDGAGSLYELHSPQTELPRLGIPKS